MPGKYWQEQLKWLLKNDLKEWGTVDEKLRLIEDTVREITARYIEETTA